MSLKSELLIYSAALEAFDSSNLSLALSHFAKISETSKIQWNMGIILATMGRHNEAIKRFGESVVMDQYLVVGWFQRGVSYFMVGMYTLAVKDFEMALLYMRDNRTVNYTQLGLSHTIHSAEILYNLGLTKIYLGQTAAGMQDLRRAQGEKSKPDHQVIDDCIKDHGRGYSVISLPTEILFRPSESKLKIIKTRDYMGKAILILATDSSDEFTSFTGITRLQRGETPQGVPLDPSHPLSRSKSLARSASVPADSLENLPIATRMTTTTQRSVTQIGRKPLSTPSLGLGLTRSLTISNPDPVPYVSSPRSPIGHARSKTVDSPGTSDYSRGNIRNGSDVRPVRPRIVIPSEAPEWDPRAQSDRYPPFRTERLMGKSQPPSAYPQTNPATSYSNLTPDQSRSNVPSSLSRSPSARVRQWQSTPPRPMSDIHRSNNRPGYPAGTPELLKTPKDRLVNMEDTYDDYHSSTQTPDLVDDTPEMPYTAIGQAFTGVSPVSTPKEMAYVYTPQRVPSRSTNGGGSLARSNTNRSLVRERYGEGQGLMLTVEDNQSQSPIQINDLVKIRIKVHVGKHTRGMSILPSDTYIHLIDQLRSKFPELHRHQERLSVNFKDEDGDMLSMQDEGDFEAAVDVARVMSQGRAEGKLEIWVE